MDDKFLSYSQSSKKRDFSNFDGTIQNLYTSDFGALTPVFVKPILADDSFKISLNAEVKVNTLSAPAYSNIKQNFYAFGVPCQSVWSHWNDFISNGSDFQSVYGSNLTNQDLKSPWKIPSIAVNQLQAITKLVKGFAIPIFTLTAGSYINNLLGLNKDSLRVIPHSETLDTPEDNKLYIQEGVDYIFYQIGNSFLTVTGDFTGGNSYPCSDSFINNLWAMNHPNWRLVMKICPYIHFLDAKLYRSNNKFYFSFRGIDFGLSIDDFSNLVSLIFGDDIFENNTVLNNFDFRVSDFTQYIKIRYFCDNFNSTVDVNNSPFGIKSSILDTLNVGEIVLNSSTYYRKFVNDSHYTDFIPDVDFTNQNGVTYDIKSADFNKISNFWSKEQIICDVSGSQGSDGEYLLLRVSDSCILSIKTSDADYLVSSFSSDSYYPDLMSHCYINDTNIDIEVFSNSVGRSCYDTSLSANSPHVHASNPDSEFAAQISSHPDYRPRYMSSADILFPFYVNSFEKTKIGYFYVQYVVEGSDTNRSMGFDYIPLIDSSAVSNGMTTFTFMLYLCNSVVKTLDYCNIPYEGFTVRDTVDYCKEFVSAMPFFSISKIWDEYFRNRTVSTPELDYCQTNGPALYLYNNYDYINAENPPNDTDSQYIDFDDENYQNSWVIPFDVLPKNGVGTFNLNQLFQDYDIPVSIQGTNEFHYFNVTCFADLFSLLTGFQLNHCVLHQVAHPYVGLFTDSTTKYLDVLYGAIIERFYLPNFYNGLLHYRYQNFNKDYFSSALLDAMSGANQEEIPDNVTELRTAEAKQSFWEQTAVARSFKKFAQKMFGTTPSHIENNRPILLGQSHSRISIGEIIQTSGTTDSSTPQGTRTGIAGGHSVSGICKKNFNEQGYLIILSSITLDSQYYQGLQRNLTPYSSFLDYPFANFYNIGNQSINMREISFNCNPKYYNLRQPSILGKSLRYLDTLSLVPSRFTTVADNPQRVTRPNYTLQYNTNYCVQSDTSFNGVFGYVPRFSEWKFNFDELHGDFRNSLMSWNTFRTLHTIPYLSHSFVNWELSGYNYDLNRLFALTDDSDKFVVSLFINVSMRRPIPYYTIPKTSVN